MIKTFTQNVQNIIDFHQLNLNTEGITISEDSDDDEFLFNFPNDSGWMISFDLFDNTICLIHSCDVAETTTLYSKTCKETI